MGFVLGGGDFDGGRGRMKFNTHLTLILKIVCMAKTELVPVVGDVSRGDSCFCCQRMQVSPVSQQN